MKSFRWNDDKHRQLQTERGVSFEQALQAIADGKLLEFMVESPLGLRFYCGGAVRSPPPADRILITPRLAQGEG